MKPIEVLIIEDNIKVSKTHQALVEKVEGFVVTGCANTIDDGRLMLATLEPDLILLDIYFPESDGMSLLEEIRSQNSPVDVILITAAKEVEILHKALRGGVFDYMIKPVFFDRFKESLTNYREHRIQLLENGSITQEDANRMFARSVSTPFSKSEDIPKGIDPVTLAKVIAVFDREEDAVFSAEAIGEKIGVSRTTGRKYLEYLISTGYLTINLNYNTKGRPERRYSKNR